MKKLLIISTVSLILSGCVSFTRVVTCSEWNEIRTPDGHVYRERRCSE